MRVMVTGGRFFGDQPGEAAFLFRQMDAVHEMRGPITLLIHGKCHVGGADNLADVWAKVRDVLIAPVPVDPRIDGRWPGAGPRRNGRMIALHRPELVIAFLGGTGTKNAVLQARKAGIEVLDLAP